MSTTDQSRPRGGRPPAKDPRAYKVEARVTREERAAIQQIAGARGLTVSDLLVTSVLGHRARS